MRWILLLIVLNGCAAPAIPVAAGLLGSGGVTLYKSETSSGPVMEFVLIKVEIHHDFYGTPTPAPK